jgi:hypothetical protein
MYFIKPDLVKAGRMFSLLICAMVLCCSMSLAQDVIDTPIEHIEVYKTIGYKPSPISGRAIGANLEVLKEARVINMCSAQATKTDDNGFFHLDAAIGDTIAFVSPKYPVRQVSVKSVKDKLNVVVFKEQSASLTPGTPDFIKAEKEDSKLLKILEKDAREEGKWNY